MLSLSFRLYILFCVPGSLNPSTFPPPQSPSSHFLLLPLQACWLFGECFDIEYENPSTFLHGLQQVLNLTKDEHLPVRLKAANSLRFLCQNQLAVQPLRSVLPQLLESA